MGAVISFGGFMGIYCEELNDPDCSILQGSGVYGIVRINLETKKHELLYIGSSKNIFKRIYHHAHLFKRLYDSSRYPSNLICIITKITIDYKKEEILLIKKYKPQLNKQHNSDSYNGL